MLAASELVANAVVHGLPPVLLTARLAGDGDGQVVTIRVSDGSRRLPEPGPASATAEHGRGLAVVAALALRWGISETSGGKEAWFEMAVPASADGGSSGRIECHNGPFGMDGGVSHGAARREALASCLPGDQAQHDRGEPVEVMYGRSATSHSRHSGRLELPGAPP